ncbi:peroxiredoxin family protein [Flavobacterium chuncheonense]|uniref:Peroxiredoxin family protein n=1 Tax=Flavobacterium chuncheonense TaxID=2026653 RepID=A0ABW5YN25_9FLAO
MMKKIAFLMVLFVVNGWAQEYSFLESTYVKISGKEFMDLKAKDSTLKVNYFLENGQRFEISYIDSLVKHREIGKYKNIIFKDSLKANTAIVLHKKTKDDVKEEQKQFKEMFDTDKQHRKSLKGNIVEHLHLTDMQGNVYTLEDLKGKVVVLNFWFTKCAPCIKEIPDLNKMKADFKNDDVVFFAITFNEKELIETFLTKHDLDLTIIPKDQKTIDQFGVKYFPTNLILDKQGTVAYVNEFFMKDMIKDMNKTISKLIKK